jgi:hypothetical protein
MIFPEEGNQIKLPLKAVESTQRKLGKKSKLGRQLICLLAAP